MACVCDRHYPAYARRLYTAPLSNYKYKALGVFSAFSCGDRSWSKGACYVQRQALTWEAFWVSLPLGALVALVLLANNIRDTRDDKEHDIKTVPVLTGKEQSIRIFVALVVLAYVAVVLMSLIGPLPLWSLIVLVSLPITLGLLKEIVHTFPIDADARTARMTTVYGVLLIVSLIIERVF
jgi:1,4-dihydroxy-2-naphthoate octaprenyltransferase